MSGQLRDNTLAISFPCIRASWTAVQAALGCSEPGIKACMTTISSLNALQGMSFKDTQYELQFQPCMRALLQGATNLKALRLHPHGTDSMSLLSSCSLKHLELHIPSKAFTGAWRGQFPDLRACLMLESLKVSTTIHDEDYSYFVPLPGLRLRYMSKLRHIELEEQTLPWHCLELPPGCQLFVRLSQPLHEIFCGNAGELVCKQTRVMWLREWYTSWQTDLARFQHLQLLVMEVDKCSQSPPLDLAKLQHIPHVRLLSKHPVSLVLTEGSWQSLEILGERGVHVTFSDVDAFVTRTKLFSFCCSDTFFLSDFRRGATSRKSPAMMMERLQAACSKHSVECYTTSHNDHSWPFTVKVTRLSNRKLKPPFDKGEEPSCPESVFMQLARTQTLVSHEDFWPQDPCKALDCA